jgi:hypothetical protein
MQKTDAPRPRAPMSQPATSVEQTSRTVAILGADALLVALPSTPTQLANACFAGGFAEVFPATWGDELIAAGCLEQLESRAGPAIFCSCPLVAEQLRGAAELSRFIIPLISPPVAVARYLRALYPGDALRITYVGDCPGAADASIDERLSPHELLEHLAKRGILPASQRPDLGTHVARDRRRFYSLPGGVPAPQWLSAQWPKRTLVDVHAGDAIASLANQTLSRGNTLIDFAPHLGCACAGAVSGTSAKGARKAVVAHEPPRAQSEIVSGAVRVEVSLASAGERHLEEVSWNDFLAALPVAFAMPADGTHAAQESALRMEPRRARGREKKVALPRAYLAARQGARRDRTGPTPSHATPSHATPPHATPPHEGITGPRNQPQRAGLAPADRWLLVGLMLSASVLVAVLTSALTVSGMYRAGAAAIATRHDTALAVASAPPAAVPAPMPVAPPARATDSVLVAATTRAVDSAAQREDAGTVGTPPSTRPHVSPVPARVAHRARSTRREPILSDKRSLSIAERGRVVPPALAGPAPQPVTQPVTQPITQPVVQPATQPITKPITQPAPASPPAATPVTNAQFLEELRAIHAEIDARKRHMDSLTRSLDSLKKISPPR